MPGINIIAAASVSPQVLVSQQLGATEAAVYTVPAGSSAKISHGALCNVTASTPIPAANGALTATAGGTLAATTYFVRSTWTTAVGETLAAPETSLAVAVNNVLNVAAPASPPANATGWNVYVSTSTGTQTKQNATPLALGAAWVEPTTGLIAGAALPAAQTTGTAVTVTLSILKTGTTMGDNTHQVINRYSLAVNDTLPLQNYVSGAMLGPGDFISGSAQYAGAVSVILTGTVHA